MGHINGFITMKVRIESLLPKQNGNRINLMVNSFNDASTLKGRMLALKITGLMWVALTQSKKY